MTLHRAHTEILILAVAAVMILLVSVANRAPEQRTLAPQAASQIAMPVSVNARPAAIRAEPASLQSVGAPKPSNDSDWVRADSVEAPAKQTRWVF
ncbi:hypothetical protein F7R01_17650 [Pseudomonas argentinensis]|uniref:Uncharacterized protein n=1 Tax=Phytopseudomonas argentinensis TaxID=289370 RepID=A0A1I3MQ45_9GAMM|nr:hypothetical protein [Pseudomonas argentinensis]KAB0546714.1 hypothetical protein F7R01_17650 [Pseudomonas argentinensis]SFI98845.1 hypothetical protein SAMN05216602_3595 [Pseudomonas argentinensis]